MHMADEMEDEIDVEGFDDKEGSGTPLPNEAVMLAEEYKKSEDGTIRTPIWNEFGVPVCDWSVDEIDLESRLTIESMLHEEQQYLGCRNGPVAKRSRKKASLYLRWTPQERLQFEKGFLSYGNRWTQIAKLIPTRSPLQVKNYARYYFPAKAKPVPIITTDFNNQDEIKPDLIHPHLPDSLNTGSPTVTTRLKLPAIRHIPHPSKRRHFQKFGFANLSSSRVLKSRSGKDASPNKRTTQKMKQVSLEGDRTSKMRITPRANQAQGQRARIKIKDAIVLEHPDNLTDESKDVAGGCTVDLFEQGGGVVRMRPESSEDEDVDVEDDAVGDRDKHQESSLIGLAATCDRIYSTLITSSADPAQSAPPVTAPHGTEEKDTHVQSEGKILRSILEGPKVKYHKTTQDGLEIQELAWNADHTYSMSVKALHKLGILRGGSCEPQEQTEMASISQFTRDSIKKVDIKSGIKMKLIVTDESEDIVVDDSDEKMLSSKSEMDDSSSVVCPQDEEASIEFKTDPEESDVLIRKVVPSETHVKQEPRASDISNTSALVQEDIGQLMGMCQHVEQFLSKEQDDVIPETPHSNNPEVGSTDSRSDDSVDCPYHGEEAKGCVTSEENETFTGNILPLRSSIAPLEDNPVSPEITLEMDCETIESSHEEENRGVSNDEEKEESDATQGETDSNGGEDGEQTTEPSQELILNLDEIDDWEKQALPEFFEGRPSKNPERYLKIRNYIYQHWLQTKPKYLNKASVRQGLKSCGDVNSIGHIHQSLEAAGAINYGVVNPHKTTIDGRAIAIRQRMSSSSQQKARRESTRKIRKKQDFEPVPNISQKQRKEEDKLPPRKSVRTGPRKTKTVPYDPFKLIECCRFTEEKEAPFHVRIQSDAMIIMDVHSHMSSTEVIGLLGGRFLKDDSILDVLLAVPCNSISTGMQCEMDPVSQTEAYESIIAKGYQVVGWYHSHPAFAANPSVRDIETQSEFQGWFSQGGAPFIGVIISPCHNYQISQSKVCCLTISKEWSPELKCRRPYQFDFTVCHSHCNNVHTMNTISSVVTKFAVYQYRSEMLYLWSRHYDISFLEKMLRSIRTYICPNQQGGLLKQIEDFIIAKFTTKTIAMIEKKEHH